MSTRLSAVLVSFLSLITAGCATSAENSAVIKTGYTKEKDIIYTPANWPKPAQGDLYLPKNAGTHPAVLLIYGGNWKAKDNRYQMASIARKLARRGYVVLNVNYRGMPEATYPAALDDLREGLRWLRTHAAEHQIDPQRIATWGYSAGGHLAALLGTWPSDASSKVHAIVAGGAPSDLRFFPGQGAVSEFMGGTLAEIPDRFREASPVAHVTRDTPPTFLYHGGADTLVPTEHPRAFKAALDAAGVRNELFWIEGRNHIKAFLFDRGAENAAIDFLDRELR